MSDRGSISHGYYYLAYRLRNLDFKPIQGCPQVGELNSVEINTNTIVVADSCPKITVKPELRRAIIYTNINGSDN